MKQLLTALLLCALFSAHAQQKVIQLYDGPAPGSEKWDWNEKQLDTSAWGVPIVYNVSNPSLTVFPSSRGNATGTAVIICPGGGFHALSISSEGNKVAEWLNK